MKKPATFTDEETKMIEHMVDAEYLKLQKLKSLYSFLEHDKEIVHVRNSLVQIRNKCWAQRHGTEATDVEGA